MTIKVRNKVNLFFIFIALSALILALVLTAFAYSLGGVVSSEAVLSAVIACVAIANIFFLYIKIEFEKTQSAEVVYFLLFLLALLAECLRLAFILTDLWTLTTTDKIIMTKALLAFRIIAPMSLLFAVIFNKGASRDAIEQNSFLLIVAAFFIAYIYPINTQSSEQLGNFRCAYSTLFMVARYAIFVMAVASQIIDFLRDPMKYTFPFALTLLCTGYMLLGKADTLWMTVTGSVLLFIGGIFYLKDVHKLYMWR